MASDWADTLLLVDDDAAIRKVLTALLAQAGIRCEEAPSAEAALEKLAKAPFDVVMTDLRMPGKDGLWLLAEVVGRWPGTPVIVLTAHGTVPLAVEAMRLGAADFILKPFDRDQLLYVARKALALSRSARDRVPAAGRQSTQFVGSSPALRELESVLARVAPGSSTVLVRGETGTGKEVVARALHARSPLHDKPFIKVDCASLPDALLESELFGYEKGAFTGAHCRKPGRVELAQGGTLFLDEIGEVTPALQKKLLRLLQDREFERLGGTGPIKADVRFVAATHRDLESMLDRGDFREDLFYRLNVVPLWLPPLRERKEDIPDLARHFCVLAAEANRLAVPELTADALHALAAHAWPGNVRELQHFIERLVVLVGAPRIDSEHVLSQLSLLRPNVSPASSRRPVAGAPPREDELQLDVHRRSAEREALTQALRCAKGNRTAAARLLGVSRRTLHYKLKELGVE
jgi:DNA-binding NtrC family response regulator